MMDVEAAARLRVTSASTPYTAGRGQHVAGDGWLTAVDDVALHYRSWVPRGQAVMGMLLFSHGIASHGAWFSETAAFLAEHGFGVYALDRRGSGLSADRRSWPSSR